MRFTHVLSMSVVRSLILLSSIPLCGYVQFTSSAAEGHWVVFWNDRKAAAKNIHIQGLCGHMFLFLLDIHLRVQWMGHMVSFMFNIA